MEATARDSIGRTFRPDIDGLRAVAIGWVMLSHLNVRALAGGFVGVDVFFVISGYLLTGNIAERLADGTFSIGEFYERRIRRIFPALVVMLAVSSAIAYAIFPPAALVDYGKSLVAAMFSYSNFYFATQAGYFFNTFTALLQHTWSLGVEEQFYLALPVCMMLAARGPATATRWTIAVLGLASFASAVSLTSHANTLAFYMPYTRAWELLLGSALALGMLRVPAARPAREGLAALAVATLVVCLFTYSQATVFPGLGALPPCVATAILIGIGERGRTAVTSFLFTRPLLFVGAISYSLYLWHWPVYLVLRLGIIPKVDFGVVPVLAILKIVVTLALATLSWRYVERPFRMRAGARISGRTLFRGAAGAALATSAIAAIIIAGNGLPSRFPPAADRVGKYLAVVGPGRSAKCFVETDFGAFDAGTCLTTEGRRNNILLLGDSHARALWAGLAQSMPAANVLQATGSACAPLKDHYDPSPCGALRRFVYDDYLPTHHVDAVVLSEAWNSIADVDALEPSLRWFRARNTPVFVVGPAPVYTAPLPMLLALGLTWHVPALAEHRLLAKMGDLDRLIRGRLAGRSGVRYASIWRAICPANRCEEYVDRPRGVPMLSDDNHLTEEGGAFAVRRMQARGELPL